MFEGPIKHLDNLQLLQRLEQSPGLIPVDIDLVTERLIWMDMGRYHFYEGQFRHAVNTCFALNQQFSQSQKSPYFSTGMDFLDMDCLPLDSIYPSGFIFNMSRCGSTLLTKALARSRNNLVFGEAIPHSKFWHFLSQGKPKSIKNTSDNQRRFRNLVLLMGRQRVDTHQNHFIKFTSFYTIFIDIIMAAFPNVPTLFLYRNPEEVLISSLKKGFGWWEGGAEKGVEWYAWRIFLTGGIQCDNLLPYLSHSLNHCLSSVLSKDHLPIYYLNYLNLKAEHLPSLLTFFKVTYSNEEIKHMQVQFAQYSKSEYGIVDFISDSKAKQEAVTSEIALINQQLLHEPYERLLKSAKNILL